MGLFVKGSMLKPSSPAVQRTSYGSVSSTNSSSSMDDSTTSNGHRYEELMANSVECPTCRGLGRISAGNDELVALIPVSDARLKPRKTVFYVIAAIIVCLAVGGLLLFFLISRSVSMTCTQRVFRPSNITYIDTNTTELLILQYTVPVTISNENFFPISVSKLELSSVLYGDKVLATSHNSTEITIPIRATRLHYVTVNMTVGGTSDLSHLIDACQESAPILWSLPMNFQITATISYLSHTESSSITVYNRRVCCHAKKPSDGSYTSLDDCANPSR